MPGKGTPRQAVRMPDALWRQLGRVAEAAGADRATVIRALVRWYVGEGDLPERPRRDG